MSIILFCFGTCISYMIAIGDILDPITEMLHKISSFFNRTTITIIFTIVFMIPLSSMIRINNLRFSSLFGVCMILYLIILTTIYSSSHSFINHIKEVKYFKFDINMWKTFPVMMFSYTSQVNVFEIEEELEETSEKKMRKVTVKSLFVCLTAYLLCGCFGYIGFLENTEGNILKNLRILEDDSLGFKIAIIIGYIGMALAVTMAYPLNIFPMRYSILSLSMGLEKLEDKYKNMTLKFKIIHYSLSIFLVALSVIIALFIQELDFVFEITGGTTSAIIAFIAPGLYILKINKNSKEYIYFIIRISKLYIVGAYLMIIIGGIIGIWSTFVSIYWK